MEQKKKLTWEERHPNGDESHHTFFEGYAKKVAAAIMASRKGKTIRDYEGILLHIPHSSTSFPSESTHSLIDLDEDEKLLIDYYTEA